MKVRIRRILFGWGLMAPAVVYLLLFSIYPLVETLRLSFHLYRLVGLTAPKFVGLTNYLKAFHSERFLNSLRVTLWFAFFSVGVQFLIGFLIANILNMLHTWTRRIITSAIMMPLMLAPVVVGFNWKVIFDYHYGPINYFLNILRFKPIEWLASPDTALASLIVADVWQWTPFMVLVLLAGLQSIPEDLRSAASIDGASGFNLIRYIILPSMIPFIFICLVIRMMDGFKIFDLVFLLTVGGPGTATESSAYYTYVEGFKYFNMGFTAAIAVIQLVIIIVIAQFFLKFIASAE